MMKQIVFIRHAQSEENVKFAQFVDGIQELRRLRWPSSASFWSGLSLLRTDLDSELSQLGVQQVQSMQSIIARSRFIDTFAPEIIFYSPLRRAKKTLLGVLGLPESMPPCPLVELSHLREASPLEHVVSGPLMKRIRAFTQHLLSCPQQRILVCGHSQHFKRLLQMDGMMRNVDVWQAELHASGQWEGLRLVHRSPLAGAHPFDRVMSADVDEDTEGRERHTVTSPNVVDDLSPSPNSVSSDEAPICRICQVDQTAESDRLIRPCRCAGSQAHVHLACLNRWRSTSLQATHACSVCKFPYRIRRTQLAELLMSENGVLIVTLLLTLLFVVISGIAVVSLSHRFVGTDIAGQIYRQVGVYPWWRRCRVRSLSLSRIHALASSLADSPYPWSLIRAYWRLLSSPGFALYDVWFCQLAPIVDVVFTGMAVLGGLGSAHFLQDEARTLMQARQANDYSQLIAFVISIASLGHRGMGRLGLCLGCAIAAREVYRVMVVQGRRMAQTIGESILSPEEPS